MSEKITLEDILEVQEMEMEEMTSYYNIISQCMVVLSKDDMEIAKSNGDTIKLESWKRETAEQAKDFLENPNNYINFPKQEEYNEYVIMEDFIKQCNNEDLLKKLNINLSGEEAFRKFKDTVYDIGLVDEWYYFRDERCLEVARKWCETNGVDYEK
ncbi:UPF0158 family protein [Clostridium gasigenes]|uniref:UPF0158 family protein n=1 Tax=Clostridium gasigenes TaxID=94869 RepID=UPI001438696D|nr:UPF0158 family protein [Clostridium gasigenes]MBU3103037.1 UPF0158 family protein [Clostridium gasigenes]MBU3135111.1 UPF0158 family protein [Clostridium gasigenes]NKF05397.1 hypothetical protein [Clostridium gasigenes]QSW18844.1 hypothetical protein J1C67_15045 [Clostridium gasigenes]